MVTLKLIDVPAQKALMSSGFTPMLGQYGVGIREFCNIFNINTKNFMEDLPMNLTIKSKKRDDITIQDLRISKTFLVRYYLKTLKSKTMSLKLVYTLFTIDLYFINTKEIDKKSLFKSKLAYLKSFGIKIVE